MKDRRITFCLTSCGRFDLLQKTLRSFFQKNDHQIEKYIIVEDSGDPNAGEHLRDIVKEFPKAHFQHLINEKRIGQIPSIDRAYAEVQTPYIFHCEDDWEFIRSGFMQPSLDLLEHLPDVIMVWLRDPLDEPRIIRSMKSCNSPHRYFDVSRAVPEYILNFNPGLRRLADYREAGGYQNIGDENQIGHFYFTREKKILLLGGSPYYRHIGRGFTRVRDDPHRTNLTRRGSVFIPRFLARLGPSIRKRALCIFIYIHLWRLGERPSFINLLNHLR